MQVYFRDPYSCIICKSRNHHGIKPLKIPGIAPENIPPGFCSAAPHNAANQFCHIVFSKQQHNLFICFSEVYLLALNIQIPVCFQAVIFFLLLFFKTDVGIDFFCKGEPASAFQIKRIRGY